MTTADKPFEPSQPWPTYEPVAEPPTSTAGRFAIYALIRAHGIPWRDADAVYFEIAAQPIPGTAALVGDMLEAAYMRALQRSAHGVKA